MASLFDTGALASLRREGRAASAVVVRLYPAVICTHVAAEILYGIAWVDRGVDEWSVTLAYLGSFEMLVPTLATASIYARLRAKARRAARQMPDPDLWIAAHAIEERLTLVTMDQHFLFFDELNVHLLE